MQPLSPLVVYGRGLQMRCSAWGTQDLRECLEHASTSHVCHERRGRSGINTICCAFGDGDVVEDAEGADAGADGKNVQANHDWAMTGSRSSVHFNPTSMWHQRR
jgi:hypothetical protein